ncbi:MAG: bifunctional hydroxymethylpyrimidine kinase/phosphomethylpyrimidine kinase [Campylobacteraceae bacterium]|nr:bifunctional hydroxymethylpyrimidine kinase/phosphomethylpyrimidine kinase [Campylobacteraceae bacterium]
MKNALTIAALDPSGGAGMLADIKVFIAHEVYAMGVLTGTTAQNTKGIFGMEAISPKMVSDGIKAIFDDIRVDAIKIGAIPGAELIKTVAQTLKSIENLPPVVLDPVMACKNGNIWLGDDAREAIVKYLFPLSTIITPNRFEAEEIVKFEIKTYEDAKKACEKMVELGTKNVMLKFGDFEGESLDIFYDGKEFLPLRHERIESDDTHGSGCSLASAIAANLANGKELQRAVSDAKDYVFDAIRKTFKVGEGCNPINHFYQFY